MKKSDYKALLERLDNSIERDQIFVSRELLEEASKARGKSSLVKEYFDANEDKLKELNENLAQVDKMLSSLRSTEGWTECKQKQGITVYFQKQEQSNMLRTKLETFFPAETHELTSLFLKMVSVFNETDLLPRWFPRGIMKSADMDRQVTKFSKILTSKLSFPPPANFVLSPREAHLFGRGFDMSERSFIIITVTTLQEGQVVADYVSPAPSKGYAPFILETAFYFELKKNGIIFKVIQSVDLLSNVIPSIVTDFAAKGIVPFEMLSNMKKTVDKFEGSIWEERVKNHPHIYEEIEKRLQNYIHEQFGAAMKTLEIDSDSRRFSTASLGGRKKSRGFAALARGLSLKRKKSKSGSRFSKDARKSYNNLDKLELYEKELKTEKEKKKESRVIVKQEVQPTNQKPPEHDVLGLLLFYFFYVVLKLFILLEKEQVLVKHIPSLEVQFAGELSKVKQKKTL